MSENQEKKCMGKKMKIKRIMEENQENHDKKSMEENQKNKNKKCMKENQENHNKKSGQNRSPSLKQHGDHGYD